MKSFLDLLQKVKTEGRYVLDRTGVGRHRIFGTQTRYDLSDGTLPVVTTRKIYTAAIVKELLWFIKGSYDTSELKKQGVNIWNAWTVTEEDIQAFADKYSNGDANLREMLVNFNREKFLDTIGEMYGAMWRNAPRKEMHKFWPRMELADLPSDKLAIWTADYEELKASTKDEIISFEDFCSYNYYATVDQLNELLINLKKRPNSSRMLVNAWIPSHIPFESLKPQENVMLGKGSLAPCHAMFQCFVEPSEEPGGKGTLSLLMFQRSKMSAFYH